MSVQDVKQSLFETNLNFDSGMANDVCVFFNQNGIQVSKRDIYLQTASAAAIISQTKLVPCKGTKQYTHYGITIQTVMSHLNGYSKQQFLSTVSLMLAKNSTLQQKLSSKIKNIEVSYRLFKKYRKSFQQLWLQTGIGMLVMNDMLSIFWVIYLLVKNGKQDVFEDFTRQVKMIVVMLKSIFQYWISCVPQGIVKAVIEHNFKIQLNDFVDEQFFLLHHVQYFNQSQKLYSARYQKHTLDFKRFAKNPIQIARYLDDISNYFYRQKQFFQSDNYVDQISYLELKKMLAPIPMRRQIQEDLPAIKLGIKFSGQQKQLNQDQKKQNINEINIPVLKQNNHYIIAQNLPQMTPLRDRSDKAGVTPMQSRILNLQWVRNCLDYMKRPEANQIFKRVFKFVENQSLSQFEEKARKQLLQLVEQFTPKCIKKQNRIKDMFSFFKYLIIKIYQDHQQKQNAQMFRQVKTFNSILCLSCDIFNFSYSSLVSSYRKQCEVFDVPLIDALKPINWIGKNVEKPAQLNNYLYSLQKRVVIKQIWQDETGYNLLKSQQMFNESSSIGYNDMIVWKRLIKHIYDRIEQLSRQVKLEYKLLKRIQNLIETILKQKPFLLHKNKIDQIIICCMTSFLSINQIHQQKTLQKVFKDYNRMDLSFNQNKDGLLSDGKQMSLSQFYNQVFLPEIQDIVDKNGMETDFLLTPIRQQYRKLFTGSGQNIMTPFAKKYPQKQIDYVESLRSDQSPLFSGQRISQGLSMFKKNILSPTATNYRTQLVLKSERMQNDQKIKKQQQSQQIENNNLGNGQKQEQMIKQENNE